MDISVLVLQFLWKILKEMGIPDHLTCLLRNLYAGQEAIIRTGHGTTGWFQIVKGVRQGCILSPCLFNLYAEFSSVQSLSGVRLFATPWIAARHASLSITNSRSSPRLRSSKSVMPSSHLILGHPLLLLPPIPPSIRVFSNESTLRMKWPKYWSFSFSISPSKEHPGRSPLEWTGWISCSPRDSQESSPTPQFKSINSSALSLLHSPLSSIHDHRKNHSLD